jgi:glucose/mannose transport system permease protein
MTIRWTRVAPQLALSPALAVTMVAFIGSILWTIYLSLTASRRVRTMRSTGPNGRASTSGCSATMAGRSRSGTSSRWDRQRAGIVFGFIPAAMIDREKRGRELLSAPSSLSLAVSLIVTGVAGAGS